VNLSALASDCGITHNTAKAWLSVLEASDLVVRLQPWHANLGKRLIKAPKLYFLDSGLACSLLGIRSAAQLMEHPLRGGVFENWVMLEVLKARLNRGLPAVSSDFLKSLAAFRALPIGRPVRAVVVYGGDAAQRRQDAAVAPWHAIGSATWW
jgi:uncharacterized protein